MISNQGWQAKINRIPSEIVSLAQRQQTWKFTLHLFLWDFRIVLRVFCRLCFIFLRTPSRDAQGPAESVQYVNPTSLNALAEIYTIHTVLQFSDLKRLQHLVHLLLND